MPLRGEDDKELGETAKVKLTVGESEVASEDELLSMHNQMGVIDYYIANDKGRVSQLAEMALPKKVDKSAPDMFKGKKGKKLAAHELKRVAKSLKEKKAHIEALAEEAVTLKARLAPTKGMKAHKAQAHANTVMKKQIGHDQAHLKKA